MNTSVFELEDILFGEYEQASTPFPSQPVDVSINLYNQTAVDLAYQDRGKAI